MSAAARAAPRLGDEEVVEVLRLLEDVDSVELKTSVAEEERQSAVTALGLDPLDAQIRQVFFFDTADLALDRCGVVVRARRIQGKGDDTTVKLRPVDPADLPADLRDTSGFGVEVDAMPGGFVCSARLKRRAKRDVRATLASGAALSDLFSKSQRRLFDQHADGAALDDLVVLGPIFVLKLRSSPKDFHRDLVAELWLYPDSSAILELSTRCEPSEAFQAAAETRAYLAQRGIDLGAEQQTKTRKALDFFAERRREG
jgi:hypothetical protein